MLRRGRWIIRRGMAVAHFQENKIFQKHLLKKKKNLLSLAALPM